MHTLNKKDTRKSRRRGRVVHIPGAAVPAQDLSCPAGMRLIGGICLPVIINE